MPGRLTRRVLAKHAAARLIDGDATVLDELAAFLVVEGRERESDTLVRDIEDQLARDGQLVITVESARKINEATREQVVGMFPNKTLHIREVIDPKLIGGLRITTPARTLDATILGKLKTLRATKV